MDDKLRLPFETVSKNLFAGAYGTVDKVGISALHLQTLDGGSYDKVRAMSTTSRYILTIAGQICSLQKIPSSARRFA